MLQTPIVLDDLRTDPGRVLAVTAGASLLDLDDGVLCLEFHSKGNTLDGDTLTVAEFAFATIPGRFKGLVVGNQGRHFSFGANLHWLLGLLEAIGGDRERFHAAAKRFQHFTTGMRTVPFPTVSAPFELTIGGALELTMYADRVQAHAGMRASLPESAAISPHSSVKRKSAFSNWRMDTKRRRTGKTFRCSAILGMKPSTTQSKPRLRVKWPPLMTRKSHGRSRA
jgi:hypothetical protein